MKAFLFLALLGAAAGAQEAPLPTAPAEPPASADTPAHRRETVVTSTRVETRVDEQPRALQVIGEEQLVERSVRTVPEALSEMEGVYVQKTNHGGGAPIIRGLYGQQVLLLVDGVRLNNATIRAGPNQFLNTVDPFTIDQVEVLRGPGSVLYGSDALGGVINVRTIWPRYSKEPAPGGLIGLRGTSYDFGAQAHVRGSFSLPDHAASVSVTGRDFNDLRGGALIGVQQYTGYEEADCTAKVRQRLAPGHQLYLQYQLVRQADAPRLDRSAPGDFRRFTEQYRDLVHARYEASRAGPLSQLSVELTAQRQGDLTERFRVARDRIDRDAATVWTFGARAESSLPIPLPGATTATFGLDSFYDRVTGGATRTLISDLTAVTASPLDARYLFGSDSLASGLFARAFTDPTAPLSAYAGVRGQLNRLGLPEDARVHDTFAAFPSPPPVFEAATIWNAGYALEAGGAWRPVPALNLLLNLGSGFRAPNIDDFTRFGAEGPGFLIPGRELAPEQSYTAELGARVVMEKVRAEAFYAATIIPGLVGNVPTSVAGETLTPDGVPYLTRLNREQATLHAVDGSVEVKPIPDLSLFASGSMVVSTQVRRDLLAPGEPLIAEPLSRQPPINGTVRARYSILPNVFAEGVVRWALAQTAISSSDRLDNRICFEAPSCNGTPGYVAVHLRASAWIAPHLNLSVAALNLFDATYRVHGSGVDEPGRSVTASVEVKL